MDDFKEYENAWHHVRGISSDEMKKAAADAMERYGDLIDLPHPVSKTHPPLSAAQRAAQFSPFAALTGYEDAIRETAEEVSRKEDVERELV